MKSILHGSQDTASWIKFLDDRGISTIVFMLLPEVFIAFANLTDLLFDDSVFMMDDV